MNGTPPMPVSDALVYIRFSLGLSEHGVFGMFSDIVNAPEPAFNIGPGYPAFLSLLIEIDEDLRRGLICVLQSASKPESCDLSFTSLLIMQSIFLTIFLCSVWLIAYIISKRRLVAWIAMIFVLAADVLPRYSGLFLTEAVSLPLFGLFSLFLTLSLERRNQLRWPVLCGVVLALLALIKPTYAYLFGSLVVVGAIVFAVGRFEKRRWIAFAAFTLTCSLLISPWMVRNYAHEKQLFVTKGYSSIILAQRLGFNKMSWPEWGVSFIYWLPNFGDSLAESVFPPSYYNQLSMRKGSYMWQGIDQFGQKDFSGKFLSTPEMIRTEILGNPLKHIFVSIALAWRGMFVSTYWGLVAWIAGFAVLYRSIRYRHWTILIVFFPALWLLAFQAAVSVSIPRYNFTLMPMLSLSFALIAADILVKTGLVQSPERA